MNQKKPQVPEWNSIVQFSLRFHLSKRPSRPYKKKLLNAQEMRQCLMICFYNMTVRIFLLTIELYGVIFRSRVVAVLGIQFFEREKITKDTRLFSEKSFFFVCSPDMWRRERRELRWVSDRHNIGEMQEKEEEIERD